MISADSEDRRYYKSIPKGVYHKKGERLPTYDEYVKVMTQTGGAVVSLKKFEVALMAPEKPAMTAVINTIKNQVK